MCFIHFTSLPPQANLAHVRHLENHGIGPRGFRFSADCKPSLTFTGSAVKMNKTEAGIILTVGVMPGLAENSQGQPVKMLTSVSWKPELKTTYHPQSCMIRTVQDRSLNAQRSSKSVAEKTFPFWSRFAALCPDWEVVWGPRKNRFSVRHEGALAFPTGTPVSFQISTGPRICYFGDWSRVIFPTKEFLLVFNCS